MAAVSQQAYRVEASGWDSKQEFFAQEPTCNGRRRSGSRCCITRRCTGALLFLRLLHPTILDASIPC